MELVGRGEVTNGNFEFLVPQRFEEFLIKEGLYQDFMSKNPAGPNNENIWDYVDMLRLGADVTRPSPYHVWDNNALAWVEPNNYLALVKDAAIKAVNAKAQELIYSFAPQYKQANMTARYIEIKELPATPELEAEAAEIKSVWDRVKAIRALSNSTNDAISAAAADSDVKTIEVEFNIAIATL